MPCYTVRIKIAYAKLWTLVLTFFKNNQDLIDELENQLREKLNLSDLVVEINSFGRINFRIKGKLFYIQGSQLILYGSTSQKIFSDFENPLKEVIKEQFEIRMQQSIIQEFVNTTLDFQTEEESVNSVDDGYAETYAIPEFVQTDLLEKEEELSW